MKHKIFSMITALMMLSAVALITGCNPPHGNKGTKLDGLEGVWKVEVATVNSYLTHVYFDGSKVYAARSDSGAFYKYSEEITLNKDGTISIQKITYNVVRNGEKIELRRAGVATYTMTKDSSVKSDDIKNAK